jgi:hypothetical protein
MPVSCDPVGPARGPKRLSEATMPSRAGRRGLPWPIGSSISSACRPQGQEGDSDECPEVRIVSRGSPGRSRASACASNHLTGVALKAPWPASGIGKRLLTLLDRAIPVQEQAHAKLDEFAKATDPGESLQKEISELTNELGTVIEEAEAARAASEFARLKSGLRRAARR